MKWPRWLRFGGPSRRKDEQSRGTAIGVKIVIPWGDGVEPTRSDEQVDRPPHWYEEPREPLGGR